MFVGVKTLSHIDAYLNGYGMAMHEMGVNDQSAPCFSDFGRWVAKKYGFEKYTLGWPQIILILNSEVELDGFSYADFNVNSILNGTVETHDKSIEMFFNLVSEFKQSARKRNGVRS